MSYAPDQKRETGNPGHGDNYSSPIPTSYPPAHFHIVGTASVSPPRFAPGALPPGYGVLKYTPHSIHALIFFFDQAQGLLNNIYAH